MFCFPKTWRGKYKDKDKYKEEDILYLLDFICWDAAVLVFTEHTKTLLNIQYQYYQFQDYEGGFSKILVVTL